MIQDFPNKRKRHCETGVLVNMLEYYGHQLSEPMAFGIGSGLHFIYSPFYKVQKTIYPILRVHPTDIARKVSNRLDFIYNEMSFGNDADKARHALDNLLNRNIPVGLVVNVKELDYFNVAGGGIDFNGHIFSALGKDGDNYVIADTDNRLPNDDYILLDTKVLDKIRFSPGFSAPHGKCFYIKPKTNHTLDDALLRKAIIEGINETCNRMLRIPIRSVGAKGFHYFAKDLRRWEKKYNDRDICMRLMWYYKLIERAGTGGAGYRFIYADFLKEAASLLQNETIQQDTEKMYQDAELWREFTLNCRRYLKKDNNIKIEQIADIVDSIGDIENEIFRSLDKCIKKYIYAR